MSFNNLCLPSPAFQANTDLLYNNIFCIFYNFLWMELHKTVSLFSPWCPPHAVCLFWDSSMVLMWVVHFYVVEEYDVLRIYQYLFILSFFFGYMNSFWFLALSSKIAMDFSVQFFNMDVFHFSFLQASDFNLCA